jgi:ribosomal protein S18 acetylase RimI-like enzyme
MEQLSSPPSVTAVQVRQFRPGDQASFQSLNEWWIRKYFRLEPKDVEALENPQGAILAKGGHIYFAVLPRGSAEEIVGTCALVPIAAGEFEVSKIAVSEALQGAGIGRKLLAEVIAAARQLGATRLYLETNQILTPAIRLYQSLGFRHLAPEQIKPSAYSRADVYMELLLAEGGEGNG